MRVDSEMPELGILMGEMGASQMMIMVKNLSVNAGDIRDTGSIPELGRHPGRGHGNHSRILAWRIP